jgi:hypothetical protein
LPLLPLLLPLLAEPVNLDGTVIAEGRRGVSPILANGGSTAFGAGILLPQVELWLRDERGELRVAYLPRLTWQLPNQLDYEARPLVLHQVSLGVIHRPTSKTQYSVRALGSVGEPDYSTLTQILGPGQAAVPQARTVASVSSSADGQVIFTRRWRATMVANVSYFHVLNVPPAVVGTMPTLNSQLGLSGAVGTSYALTPIDDLALSAPIAYVTYATDVQLFTITPTLSWHQRHQTGDVRLSLGLTYMQDLGTTHTLQNGWGFLPAANVDLVQSVVVQDGNGLWARARFTVEHYADPILVAVGPRALAWGQLALTASPDWIFAVEGNVSLSLRTTPLPENPDETAFSLRVPVRRRLSRHFAIEIGGLWSDRGPALAAPSFAFHQRQLWAYFSLTATTRDVPGWSFR